MKRPIQFVAVVAVLLLLGFAASALAQTHAGLPGKPTAPPAPSGIKSGAGTVYIPESSIEKPGDAGVRSHTNIRVFLPGGVKPSEAPPSSGYGFETPASLACIYGLAPAVPGCNPNVVTTNPTGGSQSIAVIDAYDDPWAGPDLAYFSAQFGIPFVPAQLQVVYANGVEPIEDPTGGWEFEESADIEYAHAMAPSAMIYLVEAASDLDTDLAQAVAVGNNLIVCGQPLCPNGGAGTGEMIMSWGSSETANEVTYDQLFTTPGVVYFAAAGDTPGVEYPCASPNVVCAGGTATARNPVTGNFMYEIAWSDGGGGVSAYEPRPAYQSTVLNLGVSMFRGVPDVAFDSADSTGMWVWDSESFVLPGGNANGWFIGYGTSFADVAWAGIVNTAGGFAASSLSELTTLYGNRFDPAVINDIGVGHGFCGPYSGWTTLKGWDPCTGIGTPNGYGGK